MQEFEEIYAQYYLLVYRYTLNLCRNAALAEEITQEAFFRAYKGIDRFKGDCKISSWLCTIARNYYFKTLKREGGRGQQMPDEMTADVDIEGRFLEKEEAYRAHIALHGLKEPYREVFMLRVFGELMFDQIAALFGKSASWARVTYYRAKLELQERMEAEDNEGL